MGSVQDDPTARPGLLLLEDDADLAGMLTEVLTTEGWDVTPVRTLQSALHSALTHTYDLMLVDRRVPDGDGVELIGRLRSRGLTTPALVLTAHGTVRDRVEGLDGGADDYLVKPFEVDELLARVRALMRRHLDAAPTVPFGSGALDIEGQRATRPDGTVVELTPGETALLAQLGRRPSRVFSREELRDVISPGSNSASLIDTFVYSVRRKLGAEAVRTVRSVGYRAGQFQ